MSRLWPVTDGCTDPFKDGFKNELDQNDYEFKITTVKIFSFSAKKKPAPGYKTRASTNITLR